MKLQLYFYTFSSVNVLFSFVLSGIYSLKKETLGDYKYFRCLNLFSKRLQSFNASLIK